MIKPTKDFPPMTPRPEPYTEKQLQEAIVVLQLKLGAAEAMVAQQAATINTLTEDLSFLRQLQVTYEIAANGLWTCRVCGKQEVFANTVKHDPGCRLQAILGGGIL